MAVVLPPDDSEREEDGTQRRLVSAVATDDRVSSSSSSSHLRPCAGHCSNRNSLEGAVCINNNHEVDNDSGMGMGGNDADDAAMIAPSPSALSPRPLLEIIDGIEPIISEESNEDYFERTDSDSDTTSTWRACDPLEEEEKNKKDGMDDATSMPGRAFSMISMDEKLGPWSIEPPVDGGDASGGFGRGEQQHARRSARCILFPLLLVLVLLAAAVELSLLFADSFLDLPFRPPNPWRRRSSSSSVVPPESDTVYVPGAGFSGFWYTLGRLSSIESPAERTYYCYSAGCLGTVAALSGKGMEELYELASGVQRRWKEGEISRYDVVGEFVDGLLFSEGRTTTAADEVISHEVRIQDVNRGNGTGACLVPENDTQTQAGCNVVSPSPNSDSNDNVLLVRPAVVMDDPHLLSKIRVVTTTTRQEGWLGGLRHDVRTPDSVDELRDMLVQTTWIPFATGESLWSVHPGSGRGHMDGAFSAPGHPVCDTHLGLPFLLDLFLNALNVNLGKEKVEQYWRAGVERGV